MQGIASHKFARSRSPFDHWWAKEKGKEDPLEFIAENAINDQVDAGIECHQEVRGVIECVDVDLQDFQDVDHERGDITHKEYNDDSEQHCGQTDFFLLKSG